MTTSDTRPPLSTPVPDDDLIFLIAGHRDRGSFAESRRAAVDTLVGMLAETGVNTLDFQSILDFGCGCGRILAGGESYLGPDPGVLGGALEGALRPLCQLS